MGQPAREGIPDEVMDILNGTGKMKGNSKMPEGGCIGETQRKIPDQAAQSYLGRAQKLTIESYDRSREDPAVLAAFRKWSSCMKGEGYSYSDPISAINDAAFKTPKVGKREISVALADVRCKDKVNLIGIWFAAESAYQKVLIGSNDVDLKETKRHKDELIKIAKSVLSDAR
ncbi:hypothetical protein ACWFRQ_37025 [Streptomyces niveus]